MIKKLLISAAIAALAMPAAAHAQHHGRMADANGDKVVTLAEHDAAVAKHFAQMDGNGDGRVTQAEMKAAHEARMETRKAKRTESMAEHRTKMQERLADATPEQRAKMEERRAKRAEMREKHGELREDRRAMRAERHAAMWATLDVNGDGAISLSEFQSHARARFAKADANDNGQIDADERRGKRHRGGGHHGGPGGTF